ncbi:hypothetical protein [Microbacterium sp. CIAB417]|uniref:hypothetical protein n=1 Tax=Microbacterium sp. CIAB417 TaxID=2860287 RepID=UPI001FAC8641|nr:hypothetical protein [Microbacterium sp. CIAB417]
MHAPGLARAAAAVLALEGAALLVIALMEVFGLGSGGAANLATALALIALTLIGAGALVAFAFGALRGRSWARSGGVVLQVLAIALALASLTLQPVPWAFVIAVGAPGVLGLVLLLASARREAPTREE